MGSSGPRCVHGLTRDGELWLLATDPQGRVSPARVPWDALPGYGLPLLLGCLGDGSDALAESAAASAGAAFGEGLPVLALDGFVAAVAGTLLNPLGAVRDPVRLAGRLGVLVELAGRGHVSVVAAGRREGKWTKDFSAADFEGDKRLKVPSYIATKRLRVPEEDLFGCGFGMDGDDYAGLARGLENLAERYGFFGGLRAQDGEE